MPDEPLPPSPSAVLRLDPAGADLLLDELEHRLPQRPPFLEVPSTERGPAVVFGDTHGDWSSTLDVTAEFERRGPSAFLVGLGDYVDRSPSDLPLGSVANALFLLSLEARFPERVILAQGNHETVRAIRPSPHTLPQELERLWGPSPRRYDRLLRLFERGPLAVVLRGPGAYLAHGGFPRGRLRPDWTQEAPPLSDRRLRELVWAECDEAGSRRGAVEPWTEADLERFLSASGLRTVWRGHDPDLTGRPLYHDRAMTLHTTRIYAEYGGVVAAILPLDRPLDRVTDAELRHLPSETRPPPR
jgi:hypothetical protein